MPRLNKGQPSGTNQSEGLGVPNKVPRADWLLDRQANQYTKNGTNPVENFWCCILTEMGIKI